jgi:hypothetical protein
MGYKIQTMRSVVSCVGLALLLQLPPPAAAATAEEYQAIYNHYKPVPVADLQHFRQHREEYLGEVFELRGIVQGNMSGKEGKVLLLGLPGADTLQLPVDSLTSLMNPGCAVRLIVRAPVHETDLRLVAIASQKDVDAIVPAPSRVVVGTITGTRSDSLPSRGSPPGPAQPVALYTEQQIVAAYARAARVFNRRLSESDATTLATMIIEFSRKWGVDARLMMAVVAAESRFNPLATSRKGAMGLGQLMPATARGLGVRNAYDAAQNLDACVRLIRGHLEGSPGDADTALSLALAKYNAGGGAVRRWGGVPPYRETIAYIARVKDLFLQMAPEYAASVR